MLPAGATDNGNGTYTYNNVTYTRVVDGNSVYYTYVGKATISSEKTDGKIYGGNTTYEVSYTNRYDKLHVKGKKIWSDSNNQDGLKKGNDHTRCLQQNVVIGPLFASELPKLCTLFPL